MFLGKSRQLILGWVGIREGQMLPSPVDNSVTKKLLGEKYKAFTFRHAQSIIIIDKADSALALRNRLRRERNRELVVDILLCCKIIYR